MSKTLEATKAGEPTSCLDSEIHEALRLVANSGPLNNGLSDYDALASVRSVLAQLNESDDHEAQKANHYGYSDND